VILRLLRNTANYRLPTFGPHGTKLGHSWLQWIIRSDVVGWFDNSDKGDVFGQLERLRGWSRGCTPPQECCRLLPTYFWVTWHQTRAFLIWVNNEKCTFGSHGTKLGHLWFQWIMISDLSGWFDNSEKGDMFGHCSWTRGWSCGCNPPQECCRLPPTYFWTTWHQTRAFLKSVSNKKWSFWLVWHFWKRRGVCALWVNVGVIPWLHSASGMLQTTAYLLLDHMGPN